MVTFRRAEAYEIDAAVEVWRAANPTSRLTQHASNLASWARGNGSFLAVAVDCDRFVAMGLVVPGRANQGDGDVIVGLSHLTGVAVLPSHQGRAVGGQLLDFILAEVSARGYSRVTLWVHEANLRARALFEARGFRASGGTSHDDVGEPMSHYEVSLDRDRTK